MPDCCHIGASLGLRVVEITLTTASLISILKVHLTHPRVCVHASPSLSPIFTVCLIIKFTYNIGMMSNNIQRCSNNPSNPATINQLTRTSPLDAQSLHTTIYNPHFKQQHTSQVATNTQCHNIPQQSANHNTTIPGAKTITHRADNHRQHTHEAHHRPEGTTNHQNRVRQQHQGYHKKENRRHIGDCTGPDTDRHPRCHAIHQKHLGPAKCRGKSQTETTN